MNAARPVLAKNPSLKTSPSLTNVNCGTMTFVGRSGGVTTAHRSDTGKQQNQQ
jgi:hypothetical protein